MTNTSAIYDAYTQEITQGLLARASGNEGMARVCARRAAGIVVGEYLRQINQYQPNPSAYQLLQQFVNLPDLDPQVRQVASHFLITVNHHRQLPIQADLLEEVQWLARILLRLE